ncbi:MAG: hypothetical protein QXW47_02945 [Candidatus Jordarchaeales archaeon]
MISEETIEAESICNSRHQSDGGVEGKRFELFCWLATQLDTEVSAAVNH